MTDTTGVPAPDRRADLDRLTEATLAALRAPSIFNTQPWRWRLLGRFAELWTDDTRRLPAVDPEGRMLLLSCGAALDHALTALAAGGHAATVTRFAGAGLPRLVARIEVAGRAPADREVHGRYRAIYRRRTDRRPFSVEPPFDADIAALRAAAGRHGVRLHQLDGRQKTAFGIAAAHAAEVERRSQALRDDTATWTTRPPGSGDGVSARTIVAGDGRLLQPRDFAAAGPARLSAGPGTDGGTVYILLYTDGDAPQDWLAAGEALSDVWLTATDRGLSASPISEVVEVPAVREALRHLLPAPGHPMIGLRVGLRAEPDDEPPPSRRREPGDVIGLPGEN